VLASTRIMESGKIVRRTQGVGRAIPAALLALSIFHLPVPAAAEPEPRPVKSATGVSEQEKEAAKLYKAAQSAFAANRLIEAKALLERALELRPNPSVVGVLGQVEFELGEFQHAATHLAQSLASQEHPIAVRRKMEDLLARAQKRVGTIVITTKPEGARVTVDGTEVNPSVMNSQVFVEPGTHRIEVDKEGYAPALEQLEAKAGSAHRFDFELEAKPEPAPQPEKATPPPAPPAPAPPAPAPPPPSKRPAVIVLVSGGVLTAAAVGVGVYYHVEGSERADEAKKLGRGLGRCEAPLSGDCARLRSVLDDRNDAYLTAKVLYGVGAGLAVATGVVTYLLWPKRPPAVSLWVGPKTVGVVGDF
jgi:hypothetical protein